MLFRYLTFTVIFNFVSLSTEICNTTYENEYPKNNDLQQYTTRNISSSNKLVEHFGFDKCTQTPIKFLLSQYPEEVQINDIVFCVPIFIKIENNIKLILSDQTKNISINFTTVNNSGDVIINKTKDWQYFIIKYSETNLQIIRDDKELRNDNITFKPSVKMFSTTEDKSKLKFQQYDAYESKSDNLVKTSLTLKKNSCFYMAWRTDNNDNKKYILIKEKQYRKKDKFWSITKTCCDSYSYIPIAFKGKGFLVKDSLITEYINNTDDKHNTSITTTTEARRTMPTTTKRYEIITTTTSATKTNYMTTTESWKTISTSAEMSPKASETNIIIYSSISIIVLALIVIGAFVFKYIKHRRSIHYVSEQDYVRVNDLYCKPDDLNQLETNNIYAEIDYM